MYYLTLVPSKKASVRCELPSQYVLFLYRLLDTGCFCILRRYCSIMHFTLHSALFLILENNRINCPCSFVWQAREEMNFTGKYKTGEQILRLTNERFAVPEVLFHPSDIGIQEMGIPEAIVNSINKMPQGRVCFQPPAL